MGFLRSKEERNQGRQNNKLKTVEKSLKLDTLDEKETNNRMQWYGRILKINQERIQKKVLNKKVKGKLPRWGSKSKQQQEVSKDVTQK